MQGLAGDEEKEDKESKYLEGLSGLDQYLRNSIESIDMTAMFFMEKIPSQLLDYENSTWRDVFPFASTVGGEVRKSFLEKLVTSAM